jgi:Pentapeptide repeats (8 copies)
MSEPDQTPVWHQAMRDDTRKPPTWKQLRERPGRSRAVALLPEWLSEWIIHWSHSWDFVKVLDLAGKFSLLFGAVGVWTYFTEADEREKARQDAVKAKHYRAWELIYTARGSPGDGGRKDALRDLAGDGVSLAGVPLSKANLSELKLPGADLSNADLSWANLSKADLSKANLPWANLPWANLSKANLSEAHLPWANLSWANLTGADLSWANLSWANLTGISLSEAIFCNTIMPDRRTNDSGCAKKPSPSGAQPDALLTPSAPAPASPEPQTTALPEPP